MAKPQFGQVIIRRITVRRIPTFGQPIKQPTPRT